VLLVPAGSPLAEAGVRPDDAALERAPMIGSQWERRTIDALLRERGIEPTVLADIVLVPELALAGHDERMCVLDLDGLLAPRRIGLAWHRERQPSAALRAFMQLARSVCGPLGAASAA
jgi:DNA-binding transcriptional LysR family regulator